jgi:hypothetical protein
MKLHAGSNVIEKSGNFEESKFSIEASSKAFFILSDGLYSNKVLAVIRELSTNAYDSHVEAGKKDVPFDVHIPTQLKPVFFIRDYGTGMSHEDCMQLYTTYFRSTRNNSNDAVGCLGLGSKAPFAYCDSFTVESYVDGTYRLYTAYKNEDGNPVFSLMNETSTSEPNGIKVSINVNSYDISRFHSEAHKVYEYFNTKPNFLAYKPDYAKANKILAGSNWYFDDNLDDNLIIMGQIAYPIDVNQLRSNNVSDPRCKFIENSSGLRIFMNIGDVDITPSRESLSYSKETKSNILNVLQTIVDEIATKIEEQIANQSSLFNARKKYVQISNQCSSIHSAMQSLQKSLTWKDMKLFDSIAGEYIDAKQIKLTTLEKSRYRAKIDVKTDVERMYFNDHNKYFVDDLNRGGLSRIKQHMKEHNYQSGYSNQMNYVYKLQDGESVDNCAMLAIMGDAKREDIILTSSLPKVEYNRSSSGIGSGMPAVQAMVYNEEKGQFEECTMSVKYENAHYFIESKDEVQFGRSTIDTSYLSGILKFVHEKYADVLDDATFYIVKPSVAKNRKLDERSNWRPGVEILSKIFNEAVKTHKQDVIEHQRRCYLSNARHDKWQDIFMLTQTDNEAKRIVGKYHDYIKQREKMSADMNIIYHVSCNLPNVAKIDFSNVKIEDDRFSKSFDNEIKKYPLLKLLGHPWNHEDKMMVAQYIDTIESAESMSTTLCSM